MTFEAKYTINLEWFDGRLTFYNLKVPYLVFRFLQMPTTTCWSEKPVPIMTAQTPAIKYRLSEHLFMSPFSFNFSFSHPTRRFSFSFNNLLSGNYRQIILQKDVSRLTFFIIVSVTRQSRKNSPKFPKVVFQVKKNMIKIRVPPQLSGFVCTIHPAALGLSPKHIIYA